MSKQPARVLFVDDEAPILNAMRRLFRKENYEMKFASGGHEGLECFKVFRPAVVISDQRMPEMTGVEMLSHIKQMDAEVIRIILTGHTDVQVAEDAINRGEVYRFITKPWNDEDLRAAVAAAVSRYQLIEENQSLLQQLVSLNTSLEEKVAERTKQLELRQAELIQSEKLASLGLLAGGIAHELNNPLAGILTITQLLREDAEPGTEIADDLRHVEEAAIRCKNIVAELLSFARVSSKEDRETTSVNELIEKAIEWVRLQKGKRVPVERKLDPAVPLVHVNPNRIQQVLINLISNAMQAVDAERGLVTVGTRRENGHVVAFIEDNGPGVPEEARERIFDPFFTTKPDGAGTGLGLSVSYGIVRDHGGRIDLESPAVGARFLVRLPVQEGA